jgi:hypothetical protein
MWYPAGVARNCNRGAQSKGRQAAVKLGQCPVRSRPEQNQDSGEDRDQDQKNSSEQGG